MHLRIDGARQDECLAQIVTLPRRRHRALPDKGDLAVADGHVARLHDAIGEHDRTLQNEIEIAHQPASRPVETGAIAPLSAKHWSNSGIGASLMRPARKSSAEKLRSSASISSESGRSSR